MKRKRVLTFAREFFGNPILQFTKQNIGLDADILGTIYEQIDNKLAHCPVTYAMRFDVHMPKDLKVADNRLFSRFQAHFIKKEKRAGYDPSYVAVREESPQGGVHYHEWLLVNGKRTERICNHIKNANEALNSALGYPPGTRSGLINDCTKDRNGKSQRNGIMIDSRSYLAENQEKDCFRQASYLAKDSQKDNIMKGQHEIFSSRLKPIKKGSI
jgi:hypothetical protein